MCRELVFAKHVVGRRAKTRRARPWLMCSIAAALLLISAAYIGGAGAQRIVVLDERKGTAPDTSGTVAGEGRGGIIIEEGKPSGEKREAGKIAAPEGDRVAVGSKVEVAEGEVVNGDAVSIMGDVYVDGLVTGDAVSVGGNVHVGPRGIVRGEAVSVGGSLYQADGAQVGDHVEVSFLPRLGRTPRFLLGAGWVIFLGHLLFIGLIGWIITKLVPRRWLAALATLKARAGGSLLSGIGVGIVYWILVVPLLLVMALILVVTVLGIPLVPVLLLLLLLLPVPGYAATCVALGAYVRKEGELTKQGTESEWLGNAYLVGHALFSLPWLLAVIFRSLIGSWFGFAGIVVLLAWGLIILAVAFGWGALLLSRLGTRSPHQAPAMQQPLTPAAPQPLA